MNEEYKRITLDEMKTRCEKRGQFTGVGEFYEGDEIKLITRSDGCVEVWKKVR